MVNHWTKYETEVLEAGYCLGYKLEDIANTLNKTVRAVKSKAARLSLKRKRQSYNKGN